MFKSFGNLVQLGKAHCANMIGNSLNINNAKAEGVKQTVNQ